MSDVSKRASRLTVLRHGHAVERCPTGDFDRPLDERGYAEIERAARELRALSSLPSLILASPARRTRESAAVLQRVWEEAEDAAAGARIARSAEVELRFEPRLYLASVETLQDIVTLNAPLQTHLLLVGHNPGLSDLLQHFDVPRALGTGDWHSIAR
jgi:phosphohistidine phosphatase